MTSRERLQRTLNHQPVDRVCVDFGATAVTGIAASTVSKLRNAVLGNPSYRVRVHEPYQMLGDIDDELRDALGIDVAGIMTRKTMFGFENKNWKPFTMFDGTEVLVSGDFQVTVDAKGDLLIYPEGDTTVPPSGRMPKDGYYFDAICRQEPINEGALDPADNLEEFSLLTDEDLAYYARAAEMIAKGDSGAIISVPGAAFGDIALVPGTWMKRTKGIRDIEEWYVSTVSRKRYIYKVFEGQCEIALRNLERLIATVGDAVQAAFITGTDFGTQNRSFISRKTYRELFQPFHKIVNEYVHKHSHWKTFIHSCGSVIELIPDFIESGFDVLNPVQCSAAGMDPGKLKEEFGRNLVFWGGGVDTQNTLPFGTPDAVYKEVRERIRIFGEGGGFVFNAIHNIQAKVPVENVLAMFRAIRESAQGLSRE